MRVTDAARFDQVTRNLSQASSRQAEAANVASSGLRVGKPSDDPVAAAELARLSASRSQTTAQLGAIRTVRGDAELTENALSDATDIFTRLSEIAVQGANGSLDANERASLGVEASSLKEALVHLGNTKGTRGYLFAGSKTGGPAFDQNGLFLGDDTEHVVPIGNSTPTAVSTSGNEAFVVTGGRDTFADIDALVNALNADDQLAIGSALDGIQASHAQIVSSRARAGLIVAKLDTNEGVLGSLDTQQQKRGDDIGAADPYDAYSRMTALSQSLDRAVTVAQKLLNIGGTSRF